MYGFRIYTFRKDDEINKKITDKLINLSRNTTALILNTNKEE